MSIERTKQQTACDGIQTAWQSDAFTQILHQQVATKFSMDGIIPNKEVTEAPAPQVIPTVEKVSPVRKIEGAHKKIGKIVGTMDGIKKQWKPITAS